MTNDRPQRLGALDLSGPEWIHTGLRARGAIADQPVAGQLLLHLEERSTGTLRLQRGKVRKDVFLSNGRAVGAASNLRQEALGSLLVAQGILDDGQLAFLLSEMRRTAGTQVPQKMGEVLIHLGWLGPEDVLRFLAAQTRRRLAEAIRWNDGEFAFAPGSDFSSEVIDHGVDLPRLVFAALKKSSEPESALAAMLDRHAAQAPHLVPRFVPYRDAFAEVFGPAIVASRWFAAVESGAVTDELRLANLLRDAQARPITTAIEALSLAGLLEFAAVPATRAAAPVPPGTDPRSLAHLHAVPEPAGSSGVDAIFDLDAPVPVPVYEAAPVEEMQDVSSGVIALDPRVQATIAAPAVRALPRPAGVARPPDETPTPEPIAGDSTRVSAEIYFSEARVLLSRGNGEDAILRFEKAVRAAPDEVAYRTALAQALLSVRGAAAAEPAREHLTAAITLDPGHAPAHDGLGRLATSAGDEARARAHLARALALDPERLGTAELLLDNLDRAGQHAIAEATCRELIATLGQRALPVRLALWRRLAALYDTKLANPPAARLSHEMAARLAPDDVDLQRKVVELNAHDLDHWRDTARALSAEWRQRPSDGSVGAKLRDLYLRVGKRDGASVVAAAMVLRGTAAEVDRQLIERHRQLDLMSLMRPLDASVWTSLRHPDEHPAIEGLFGRLVATGVLPIGGEGGAAVSGGAVLTAAQQPEPFRRVFLYLCDAFGFEEAPWLVRLPATAVHVRIMGFDPFTLAVSPELLAGTDTLAVGFRLARAFSLAEPARAAGATRSGRTLRPYLTTILGLRARPVSMPGAPEGAGSADDAPQIAARFAACPPDVRAELRDQARQLVAGSTTVDLSTWARALRLTADRTGLVVCRDLQTAAGLVAADSGRDAALALLDYALSPEHIELRAALGFVTVNESADATSAARDRRSATRVDLEVEIGMESESNLYTGILQDISTGGVFIATHQLRPVGERLKIQIRLPQENAPIEVETEVRWVRDESSARAAQDSSGMGLRFLAPDPRVVDACARFMRKRDSLLYDTD